MWKRLAHRARDRWTHDRESVVSVLAAVLLVIAAGLFLVRAPQNPGNRFCEREYRAASSGADSARVDRYVAGAHHRTCGLLRTTGELRS